MPPPRYERWFEFRLEDAERRDRNFRNRHRICADLARGRLSKLDYRVLAVFRGHSDDDGRNWLGPSHATIAREIDDLEGGERTIWASIQRLCAGEWLDYHHQHPTFEDGHWVSHPNLYRLHIPSDLRVAQQAREDARRAESAARAAGQRGQARRSPARGTSPARTPEPEPNRAYEAATERAAETRARTDAELAATPARPAAAREATAAARAALRAGRRPTTKPP